MILFPRQLVYSEKPLLFSRTGGSKNPAWQRTKRCWYCCNCHMITSTRTQSKVGFQLTQQNNAFPWKPFPESYHSASSNSRAQRQVRDAWRVSPRNSSVCAHTYNAAGSKAPIVLEKRIDSLAFFSFVTENPRKSRLIRFRAWQDLTAVLLNLNANLVTI